jgi:hypothetical protein
LTPDQGDDRTNLHLTTLAGSWTIPPSAVVFATSLAAAILFLLLGPYSNFGPAGFLDPWFYTGYFTHFSYLIHHYGITYYVSRLPWILPGLLVFKVATPAAATVILNALIMACSATALYFIVAWHYGKLAAVLACIALMTNPYFIYSVSWDYPDGPATAYSFLALACFLRPIRGRIPNSALGGACLALSAYTNLAGLPVLLGILAIPLWRFRRSFKELIRQGLYVLCGVLALTLVLAIIGKLLLGTYLFYMPQIEQIEYTFDHPNYLSNMWGTGYAWIPAAYRLSPALLMLFAGGVMLARRRECKTVYVEGYIGLVITCALFCIFEFGFHNVGLRVPSCTTYLMCPLLAFAGLLLGECLYQSGNFRLPKFAFSAGERRLKPGIPPTAAIWLMTALFGLGLPFYFALAAPMEITGSEIWTLVLVAALSSAVCIVLSRPRQVFPYALLCCIIFMGLFFGPAVDPSLGYVWGKGNASFFQSLMGIENVVDSGVPAERGVKFWFDVDGPAHGLFDSAYSLYLWGYYDFSKQLPSDPLDDLKGRVNANTTLVHLTLNTGRIPDRNQMLAARGIVTGNERRWIVPSTFGNVYVVLEDVLDVSGMH